MTQYIVSGSLGCAFKMRNGVLVPMTYRRYDLGNGWIHWMHNKTWNAAYKDIEDSGTWMCEHPEHRNQQVHNGQALAVREMPVCGRA